MRRFPSILAAPLTAALLVLAGCSVQSGPELSAPDALARAEAGQLTVIDVRTPQEWRQTGVGKGVQRLERKRTTLSGKGRGDGNVTLLPDDSNPTAFLAPPECEIPKAGHAAYSSVSMTTVPVCLPVIICTTRY